jgi:hypothetical protein
VRELSELLRIPSISGDPSRLEDMRSAAEWRPKARVGGRVVETDGHPVVISE